VGRRVDGTVEEMVKFGADSNAIGKIYNQTAPLEAETCLSGGQHARQLERK
jgi:hypothetical protein